MSERVVRGPEDVRPFLKPLSHRAAYRTLKSRSESGDFEWYVGHPNSLMTHRLGYERDGVTPSNSASVVTRRLNGEGGDWIARGTVVARKALVVPADRSEEGIDAFVHARLNTESTETERYGFVLVNEPGLFFSRKGIERQVAMKTNLAGMTLASRALYELLGDSPGQALLSPEEADEIKVVHKEVRSRLQIAQLLKAGRGHLQSSER